MQIHIYSLMSPAAAETIGHLFDQNYAFQQSQNEGTKNQPEASEIRPKFVHGRPRQNASFFPGFGAPHRSFSPDVRRDIR